MIWSRENYRDPQGLDHTLSDSKVQMRERMEETMSVKRRRHRAEYKFRVALAATGDKTLSRLA